MTTLKEGDKVLAKRPGRSTYRNATVVQAATKATDSFVKIKFPGDNKVFPLQWKSIKLTNVTPVIPLTKVSLKNDSSNVNGNKDKSDPAVVIDLTADDEHMKNKKEEKEEKEEQKINGFDNAEHVHDNNSKSLLQNGNSASYPARRPFSANQHSNLASNTVTRDAQENGPDSRPTNGIYDTWRNETEKSVVIDPYLNGNQSLQHCREDEPAQKQHPNHFSTDYTAHALDDLNTNTPSTNFDWRRNEATDWRRNDNLRTNYKNQHEKHRDDPHDIIPDSRFRSRENRYSPPREIYRDFRPNNSYSLQPESRNYHDDPRYNTSRDPIPRVSQPTGHFRYCQTGDTDGFLRRNEPRDELPSRNLNFAGDINNTYQPKTGSSQNMIPPEADYITTQNKRERNFEWNAVTRSSQLNIRVVESSSESDTLSESIDERDLNKRSSRNRKHSKPVRKKSRIQNEIKLRKDRKGFHHPVRNGFPAPFEDRDGRQPVDLDDIPIPRTGTIQEQQALQSRFYPSNSVRYYLENSRNHVLCKSGSNEHYHGNLRHDEISTDPYTSPDIGGQSASQGATNDDRYPFETVLAGGISSAVPLQHSWNITSIRGRGFPRFGDSLAESFQAEPRFPYVSNSNYESESDANLEDAYQESRVHGSIGSLMRQLKVSSVSTDHVAKRGSRRKGTPKCIKDLKRVVQTNLDAQVYHPVTMRFQEKQYNQSLIGDRAHPKPDTSSTPLEFDCVCKNSEFRNSAHDTKGASVQCGLCGLWSHLHCIQLSNEELVSLTSSTNKTNTHFMCASCADKTTSCNFHITQLMNSNNSWIFPVRPLTIDDADKRSCRNKRSSISNGKKVTLPSIRPQLNEIEISERAKNMEMLRTGVMTSSIGSRERCLVNEKILGFCSSTFSKEG